MANHLSSTDNIHQLHTPDGTVIRQHLELLFRRARSVYPEGLCEIAWSDPTGHVTSANTFPITPAGLDAATELAVKHNGNKRNLYVGVNPRKPGTKPYGRAGAADVEIAFFQFVEIDGPEGAEMLRRAPLPYTWAVTTGRVPNPRPHAYWELTEPTRDLSAWSAQQKALEARFLGDGMSNPDRIMRLAGTINYPSQKKIERGYRVEKVTLRHVYSDGVEMAARSPVSSSALSQVYPWQPPPSAATARGAAPAFDPETGEILGAGAPGAPPSRPIFGNPLAFDPLAAAANIRAGVNLHNNARDLAAHLVDTGHRDWVIEEVLTHLLTPVSDGGTLGQIPKLIESARAKYAVPEPVEDEDFSAPPPEAPPLALRPVGILNPAARAPRDWLVPYRMMRRHVTMTTAAPGVGKSTLVIEEAVSLASGADFLGFGIKRPMRVAIINNEETRDEIERRIEATCVHFDVPFTSIADRLFIYSGVDAEKLILARADQHGNVIPTVHTEQLAKLVLELKLDLTILDPFVQTHYVEESSNEQISRAMVQMRSIGAGEYPSAVHIVHHNRKAPSGSAHQAGDLSAARGASSMGGEAHFFFTLADMSQQDAEVMNILEADRINYIRLDDAKRKMAPANGARWFERYGVVMPYGKFGEEVGVLLPREFNELKVNITTDAATDMLKDIDRAWASGLPYSNSPQSSDRYVVNSLMRKFQMTRTGAKFLIKDWLVNGVVQIDTKDTHAKLRGLRVVKWPG
jgi:hypothetical protein